MIRVSNLLLLIGAALASAPLAAQSTRERLESLEARAAQLESILKSAALVELSQAVDTQSSDLRTLRGELELLQQSLQALRREQAEIGQNVERRLSALEARTPVPSTATVATTEVAVATSASPVPATPSASTLTPEALYGGGFDALKAGRYPQAIEDFRAFIAQHSDHPLADNAAYWLGQTYYVTREFGLAVEAFALVRERTSDPRKAPDALLKKGLSEIELRRTADARASLQAVISRYPNSEAAAEARSRLERLR